MYRPTTVDGPFVDRYRWPSLTNRWDRGLANFVTTQLYQGASGETPPPRAGRKEGGAEAGLVTHLASQVSKGLRVLVVHGERDAVVPLAVSKRLVEAITPRTVDGALPPGTTADGAFKRATEAQTGAERGGLERGSVTFLAMGETGHIPHEEHPEEFVRAVADWEGEGG